MSQPLPTFPFVIVVPATIAWFAVVAAITHGSATRRRVGMALAVFGSVSPFLVAGPPILRAIDALGTSAYVLRTIDLVTFRPRGWGPLRRMAHVASIFDSRTLVVGPPRVAVRLALSALAYGAAAALAAWALVRGVHAGANVAWVVRWFWGVVFVYMASDATQRGVRTLYGAAGFSAPDPHRVPIASKSLAEFWGERWNRIVSAWLREHCFRPLARRRRPGLGLWWAFVVSGAVHSYLAAPAAGWIMAIAAGVYFVVQVLLLGIEARIGVRHWPTIAARAWTVAAVVVPAPLLVEPILRVAFTNLAPPP